MVQRGLLAVAVSIIACGGLLRAQIAPQDAPPEPTAALPLEQARDLSGVWMQVSWYTNLNMGPGAGLPMAQALRGATDPTNTATDSLTAWAKEKSKDWTIYNDPLLLCNSPGPMAYNAPYAFEMLQTPRRVTMLMEYYHEVRRIWMDGRKHPEDNPNRRDVRLSSLHTEKVIAI